MNEKLKGIFVPMITPFSQQKLNLDGFTANIKKLNATPVAGYMPLGSNGEFAHLSDEEQLALLKTLSTYADKGKIKMVGAARQSAYSTVEFIKKAYEYGADFFSVLCPSYYAGAMDHKALVSYYAYVAENSPVPILLYNCPKFSAGVTLAPETVKELALHPNIAGMKDTSVGNIEGYLEAVRGLDFEVVAGSIENMVTGLPAGASGGVISMANYLPQPCSELYTMFINKDPGYEEFGKSLVMLNRASSGKYGVPGVKAAAALMGYDAGEPRIPLLPLSNELIEPIKKALSKYLH